LYFFLTGKTSYIIVIIINFNGIPKVFNQKITNFMKIPTFIGYPFLRKKHSIPNRPFLYFFKINRFITDSRERINS